MRTFLLVVLAALLSGFTSVDAAPPRVDRSASMAALADDDAAKKDGATEEIDEEELEISLERFFPEKSFFGPSARGMAFSDDGRYGAYLYRPYVERRHGADLWIYDVETGASRRVTKVSVMAEYQQSTRDVREDRIKRAKKKGGGKGAKSAAPAADDALSGTWEGRIKGGADSGLPPAGLTFTLAVRLLDGGRVSGTFSSSMRESTIREGRFDAKSGALTCTLEDTEEGTTAELKATIDETGMKGTITIDAFGLTLDLEATRREAAADEQDDETSGKDAKKDDATKDDDEESDDEGRDDEDDDEIDLGDVVDDKDADADDAPRYGGVSSFEWAPEGHELLFIAGGDLYRYTVEDDAIERLTRTREFERDVQYLPDGSGYTYQRGSALIRVHFGSSLQEQIDPRLENGETMSGYRVSPDGTRLVVLATKGESYWGRGRQVSIVSYRGRFASVRTVTRHMSDDPFPEYTWSIYLYDLEDHLQEDGTLERVFEHAQSGPRDIMAVPEWAPDSSRVAWVRYEQKSGHVQVVEAGFEDADEDADEDSDEEADADTDEDADADEDEDADADEEDDEDVEIWGANVVYQFLHNGGPTTPPMIHPYYLADSRRLVFMTELTGYRQLHVLDPVYENLEQLTKGRYEIYPFEIDDAHEHLFALTTRDDPNQQHVERIDLATGEVERLSTREGVYDSAAVSDDGAHVLATHVDFGAPRELVAVDVEAGEETDLTDSHPEEAHKLTVAVPEYFTYENRHGQTIHGHMFKPDDWSADDERPLLIYVYGGPLGTRKMATRGAFSAPSYFFAWYMAKKHGYVTCTIDPRGVSGYGALFEKSNYEQVGKPQVEDLVDGAKWFIENMGVAKDRVGLHGWSFGGFQTQMCLYTEPDVFACGIAGAGPTEWENYNSWYSTGTIGPSRTGKTDLDKFSLLPLAKNLKAKLLLVHGMEDSNVLYQDTVRVYRELLKAGKEDLVDLFLDPTGGHGLGGDVKTLNRYRKYEEFLLRCIGEGTPAGADADEDEETDEDGDS